MSEQICNVGDDMSGPGDSPAIQTQDSMGCDNEDVAMSMELQSTPGSVNSATTAGRKLEKEETFEPSQARHLTLEPAKQMDTSTVDDKSKADNGNEASDAKDDDEFVIISSTYKDRDGHSRSRSTGHHRHGGSSHGEKSRSRNRDSPRHGDSKGKDGDRAKTGDAHEESRSHESTSGRNRKSSEPAPRQRSRESSEPSGRRRSRDKEPSEPGVVRHKKPDEERRLNVVASMEPVDSKTLRKCFPNSKLNRRDGRNRTLFLGPIEHSMLSDGNLEDFIKKATTMSATWKVSSRTKKMEGNMALHFMTADDECDVRSKLKERQGRISNHERVFLKTPSRHGVNVDTFTVEWEKALFPCKASSGDVTSVFIHKLPPETGRLTLYELFPNACGAVVPLRKDGTSEGYALVEFLTLEEALDAAMFPRTINEQPIVMFVLEKPLQCFTERTFTGDYIRRDTISKMARIDTELEALTQQRFVEDTRDDIFVLHKNKDKDLKTSKKQPVKAHRERSRSPVDSKHRDRRSRVKEVHHAKDERRKARSPRKDHSREPSKLDNEKHAGKGVDGTGDRQHDNKDRRRGNEGDRRAEDRSRDRSCGENNRDSSEYTREEHHSKEGDVPNAAPTNDLERGILEEIGKAAALEMFKGMIDQAGRGLAANMIGSFMGQRQAMAPMQPEPMFQDGPQPLMDTMVRQFGPRPPFGGPRPRFGPGPNFGPRGPNFHGRPSFSPDSHPPQRPHRPEMRELNDGATDEGMEPLPSESGSEAYGPPRAGRGSMFTGRGRGGFPPNRGGFPPNGGPFRGRGGMPGRGRGGWQGPPMGGPRPRMSAASPVSRSSGEVASYHTNITGTGNKQDAQQYSSQWNNAGYNYGQQWGNAQGRVQSEQYTTQGDYRDSWNQNKNSAETGGGGAVSYGQYDYQSMQQWNTQSVTNQQANSGYSQQPQQWSTNAGTANASQSWSTTSQQPQLQQVDQQGKSGYNQTGATQQWSQWPSKDGGYWSSTSYSTPQGSSQPTSDASAAPQPKDTPQTWYNQYSFDSNQYQQSQQSAENTM